MTYQPSINYRLAGWLLSLNQWTGLLLRVCGSLAK